MTLKALKIIRRTPNLTKKQNWITLENLGTNSRDNGSKNCQPQTQFLMSAALMVIIPQNLFKRMPQSINAYCDDYWHYDNIYHESNDFFLVKRNDVA